MSDFINISSIKGALNNIPMIRSIMSDSETELFSDLEYDYRSSTLRVINNSAGDILAKIFTAKLAILLELTKLNEEPRIKYVSVTTSDGLLFTLTKGLEDIDESNEKICYAAVKDIVSKTLQPFKEWIVNTYLDSFFKVM